MKLDGIHHVTAISENGQRNADFYAGVLGLRMVKKTVNQDDPSVYHLFYADEKGTPGSDITFFEFPGVPRGRAGEGMIHTVVWRVGSSDSLDFWAERLAGQGLETEREDGLLRFDDPEGLTHELVVAEVPDQPLIADHPEVPREVALQGFHGVRAYTGRPEATRSLIEDTLGFVPIGDAWEVRGAHRGGLYYLEDPPRERGVQGAGTVHHVAFASEDEDHESWRERVSAGGANPTRIIDRFWFRSIYFREPSGVLFEIATLGPGFAADEPLEHLGESLVLPPALEHLRDRIESTLKPVRNPRQVAA
jgi:glyoxalase family protein